MVALNVVLAHLFAQFPALLKAKLNTKLAMLASIGFLAILLPLFFNFPLKKKKKTTPLIEGLFILPKFA